MEQLHVLIESETKKRLQLMQINISAKVREFLDVLANTTENVDVINLEIKKIELERTEKEIANLKAKRETLFSHINQIERMKEDGRLSELKKKEAHLKNITECKFCHEAAPVKGWCYQSEQFGSVCNRCVLNNPKAMAFVEQQQEARL